MKTADWGKGVKFTPYLPPLGWTTESLILGINIFIIAYKLAYRIFRKATESKFDPTLKWDTQESCLLHEISPVEILPSHSRSYGLDISTLIVIATEKLKDF